MNEKQNLFSDFPTISRAAWLEKIEKDLKGKPLEDLFWQLEENIRLSPVYHPDDEISPVNSIQQHKPDNDWEIGGYIRVVEPTEANAEMLEGLQGGLMAVQLNIEKVLSHSDLERLFEQVETDFISTHFSFSGNPLDLFLLF